MQPLSEYAANVTSQNGEDGVLAEIFRRIGRTNSSCVEFGAWDGKHLSNSWTLWHDHSWNAMLIEGDRTRYQELLKKTASHKLVTPVNRFVQPEGEDSLGAIAVEHGFSMEPDLLSIDIDGDDIYIFESLGEFRPRVVVIEFNSTFPPDVAFRQNLGDNLGASAKAILEVASRVGFSLAHATDTNLILVRSDEFERMGFAEPALKDVHPESHLTHVIMSYDGQAFLMRSRLPYQPATPPGVARRLGRLLLKTLLGSRQNKPQRHREGLGLLPIEVVSK